MQEFYEKPARGLAARKESSNNLLGWLQAEDGNLEV
jgi:hypothetical protein